MSGDLFLPNAALDAYTEAVDRGAQGGRVDVAAIAAPVVAAELRRLAGLFATPPRKSDLLDRADELDGGKVGT